MYYVSVLCIHAPRRARVGEGDVFCKYVNVYAIGLWIGKDPYRAPHAEGAECIYITVLTRIGPATTTPGIATRQAKEFETP